MTAIRLGYLLHPMYHEINVDVLMDAIAPQYINEKSSQRSLQDLVYYSLLSVWSSCLGLSDSTDAIIQETFIDIEIFADFLFLFLLTSY